MWFPPLKSLIIALTISNEIFLTFCKNETSEEKVSSRNISNILNHLEGKYDRRIRPNFGGDPVRVSVNLKISEILSIDEVEADWTFEVYSTFTWFDKRMAYDNSSGISFISLGEKDFDNIWLPDLRFGNEKKANMGEYNSESSYLKLYSNGKIQLRKRSTVKSSCLIEFYNYPFDFFNCSNPISSLRYSASDLILEWNVQLGSTIVVNPTVWTYHHFLLVGENLSFGTGDNVSWLQFRIFFRRGLAFYILHWYLPVATVVWLSFLAFFFDRGSIPERLGLGMTATLTITIIWSSINTHIPPVTYLKGIDIYLGFCFIICCASVVVNTVIGYVENLRKNDKKMAEKGCFTSCRKICIPHPRILDRCAKILFPFVFACFICFHFVNSVPGSKAQLCKLLENSNTTGFYPYSHTSDIANARSCN